MTFFSNITSDPP